MSMGIVSYGLHLPERMIKAADIAREYGLDPAWLAGHGLAARHAPEPDDQPVGMAGRAAAQALERAGGLGPEAVDVLIWTGEEYKDYVAQTASIRLQEELGCRRAWAFDLVGQGVTLFLGLKLAQDLMRTDADVQTVLLAGGTRNCDLVDPANPDTGFMLPYAAGGAALLLRRDHDRNQVLAVTVSTDPDLADAVCVPGGGTAIPYAPDNLDSAVMHFQVREPERLAGYLAEEFPRRLAGEVSRCCAGAAPDILALRHLAPAQRRAVLAALGLGAEASPLLEDLGHHGADDVVIALDRALSSGSLRDGQRLALASAGIGFTYAAALVRWGAA